MTDRIDGYLSRRAQGHDQSALVVCRRAEDGLPEEWLLQRPGHPDVGLGSTQHDAAQAVHAWLAAQRAMRRVS